MDSTREPGIPRHHAKRWHARMEAARESKEGRRPRLKGIEEFPSGDLTQKRHMLSGSLLRAVAVIIFAAGVGWMLG